MTESVTVAVFLSECLFLSDSVSSIIVWSFFLVFSGDALQPKARSEASAKGIRRMQRPTHKPSHLLLRQQV